MQAHAQVLPTSRLEELSNTPGTSVLRHVYDTPEATMPPAQQEVLYRRIIQGFDAACRMYPAESNECLRERVLNSRPEIRLFQRLYTKTFAMATLRARTPEEEDGLDRVRKAVMFMLASGAKEVEGESAGDREARVLNSCMLMSLREAQPEDYEGSSVLESRTVVDASTGLPRELPDLTPIDHRQLGPSTVRQHASARS